MSVRIGIDFRAAISHPCGIARYTRELTRGLLDLREDLELALYAATRFGHVADRIPRAIREHPRVHLVERRLPAKALRALSFLPGFRLEKITGPMALLHHTDLTYLPSDKIPEIVTVHDLAFEVSPEFHDDEFRRTVGPRVREAVARARRILVPSITTRDDLIERYGVQPGLIRVVPHGVDHVLRRREDTDETVYDVLPPDRFVRPFILHVGTIEPRKNLPRLVRAFEWLRRRGLEVDLVLAGARGWMTEEFDQTVHHSPYRDAIHLVGAVSEVTLRDLYQQAAVVAYPSLYEGFGLPIVEALALGKAVLTSNRASMVEVAGDAAWMVDPEDEWAIAAGLEKLLEDDELRSRLGEAGRRRTHALTWRNTARATWNVYRELFQDDIAPLAQGVAASG